jgi:hypothetical protein
MTVFGFLIGVFACLISSVDPFYSIVITSFVALAFHILAIAATSYVLKYKDLKAVYLIKKDTIEAKLDSIVREIEKKEVEIRDAYEFIRETEREEDLKNVDPMFLLNQEKERRKRKRLNNE